jgi:hypothetical protein
MRCDSSVILSWGSTRSEGMIDRIRTTENEGRFADMGEDTERTHDGEEPHM